LCDAGKKSVRAGCLIEPFVTLLTAHDRVRSQVNAGRIFAW